MEPNHTPLGLASSTYRYRGNVVAWQRLCAASPTSVGLINPLCLRVITERKVQTASATSGGTALFTLSGSGEIDGDRCQSLVVRDRSGRGPNVDKRAPPRNATNKASLKAQRDRLRPVSPAQNPFCCALRATHSTRLRSPTERHDLAIAVHLRRTSCEHVRTGGLVSATVPPARRLRTAAYPMGVARPPRGSLDQ